MALRSVNNHLTACIKKILLTLIIVTVTSAVALECFQSKSTSSNIGATISDSDYILIPWSIGSVDNVVTLKQPRGYTSLWAGAFRAILGPNYNPQARTARPSAEIFSFAALLPDMRPHTKDNLHEFTRRGGGDVVEGIVKTSLHIGNWRRERDFLVTALEAHRSVFLGQLTADHSVSVTVGEKPARFGLKRIGHQNIPDNLRKSYLSFQDLYFDGDTPETSFLFIICDAEEIPSKEEDITAPFVPQCSHFFILEELNATVQMRYRRVFLPYWMPIQLSVEKLLKSFVNPV
jgi:hypothetical protein